MTETKAKRGRQPAKNEVAAALIKALTHVSVVKPEGGAVAQPYMSHVMLNEGWAITFDGILAAGHPIPPDISGYVHTKLLSEALSNTGKSFSLTVQDTGAFEIVSGNYTSLVPSLSPDQVIATPPDPLQAGFQYPDAFVKALENAASIISDKADKLVYASIRLNNGTLMSTSGQTLLEASHGNYMPVGVVLPERFASAVVKLKKQVQGFGLGANWETFTIYFTDGSWLRTNTYMEGWPQPVIDAFVNFFNGVETPNVLPANFEAAARAVFPFADPSDGYRLIIRPGLIRTHMDKRQGAALEVKELDFTADLPGKNVLAVTDQIKTFAMSATADGLPFMVFYGEYVRGVIAGMRPLPEPEPEPAPVQEPAALAGWATGPVGDAWAAPQQPTQPQAAFTAPSATGQAAPGQFAIATASPQPVEQPQATQPQATAPQPQAAPIGAWLGGPPAGLANDPEFLEGAGFGAEGTGQFAHGDEALPASQGTGVDFGGGFNSAAWLATVEDDTEQENYDNE